MDFLLGALGHIARLVTLTHNGRGLPLSGGSLTVVLGLLGAMAAVLKYWDIVPVLQVMSSLGISWGVTLLLFGPAGLLIAILVSLGMTAVYAILTLAGLDMSLENPAGKALMYWEHLAVGVGCIRAHIFFKKEMK